MKAHNPIDNMFQQHFADATIPMNNQDELWTRISKKKDDKRRGFFWFGALGLVICSVVGFGVINFNNSSAQNVVGNVSINTSITNPNLNNTENSQVIVADLSEDENQEKELAEVTSTDRIGKDELSSVETIRLRDKEIRSPKSGEVFKDRNNEEPVSGAISAGMGQDPNTSMILNQSNPVRQLGHRSFDESNAVVVEDDSNDLEIQELEQRTRKIFDLDLLNMNRSPIQLSNNLPPIFTQSDSWSRCEVKTPGHLFVDVYGQAGLPIDGIELTQPGSDQTTYKDLWETRFDPKLSWHGGAQIGYEFRNGLRISAGAEYQEIVTQYSDIQQVTETVRVYNPQAYFIIDANGDRVWVGDIVTAINVYENKFVRKNTHTLLHVPLQLSYDIYKKPGFHVALDVAAALNVSKTYEGQYIRSDQTLIMIDENNHDNYISKDIGVSFSAGLHVGKYFNDNWEAYVSPRFRYNPNSYLLDSEALKITRNVIGLRAGIRYHF